MVIGEKTVFLFCLLDVCENNYFLHGFSEERKAIRLFSLSRIKNAVLTKEPFVLPNNFDYKDSTAQRRSVKAQKCMLLKVNNKAACANPSGGKIGFGINDAAFGLAVFVPKPKAPFRVLHSRLITLY